MVALKVLKSSYVLGVTGGARPDLRIAPESRLYAYRPCVELGYGSYTHHFHSSGVLTWSIFPVAPVTLTGAAQLRTRLAERVFPTCEESSTGRDANFPVENPDLGARFQEARWPGHRKQRSQDRTRCTAFGSRRPPRPTAAVRQIETPGTPKPRTYTVTGAPPPRWPGP